MAADCLRWAVGSGGDGGNLDGAASVGRLVKRDQFRAAAAAVEEIWPLITQYTIFAQFLCLITLVNYFFKFSVNLFISWLLDWGYELFW